MKILHKYVLKEHLGPLLFALTALTSLLLLQYIAKRFGELVGKGLPWSVIFEFLGLSIPLTVALSLPMAVLVATLYAFSRLAAENEITAMKASGVSLRDVLTPVLWAAAGVTIFMVGFNDQILPRANHKLRTLQGDIAQKKPTFALSEQVINEVSPGKLYLRAGHLSQTSNRMREITIYDMGDPTIRRTIYADSGNMAMTANQQDLQLTLYSGTVQDVPTAHIEQLQRLYFDTQKIRVAGVGNAFQKTQNDSYKGEREMSVCEMQRNAVSSHKLFVAARKEYLQDVAIAKKRGIKLTREALTAKTEAPVTVGVGRVYCNLLAQFRIKELLAEVPLLHNPVPQDTGIKVNVKTADKLHPETLNVDSLRAIYKTKLPGRFVPTATAGSTIPPPGSKGNTSPGAMAPPPGSGQASEAPDPAIATSRADTVPPGGGMPIPNDAIPGQVESARLRLMDSLRSINLYEVEIQKKFALAAACFIFVLLGAPIALRFPRGGVGLTIGVSLVVFGLYYVGLIAGESLARRGLVPPVVSMWIANLLFGTLALILLARMGRESGTSRGGDLSEMVDTVRQKVLRRPARSGRRVVTPSVKS
ncbi:MAG TPA: LptF/LptG family permease [Gemmatimonadaceae bacterium]|nr:LptF/LptG family permease [Gemmatimonadaceae bacterium]